MPTSETTRLKSGNAPGFFWNLLKAGKKYGVIASSDHCSTHISYAVLYVSDMSREAVLGALRKRHCYAATDNILLDVRAGGDHMMGDVFASEAPPVFAIHVIGTGPIKQIDIVRNAEIIHTVNPGNDTAAFSWTDPKPVKGESSYYVRVIQENGELAWASPMWVTYLDAFSPGLGIPNRVFLK